MKTVQVIANPQRGSVYETLTWFTDALMARGLTPSAPQRNPWLYHLARGVKKTSLGRQWSESTERAFIAPVAWGSDTNLFPAGWTHEVIPYCMDCWPAEYPQWESLFRRYKVKTAFFSARANVSYFSGRLPQMSSHWLPEAISTAHHRADLRLRERPLFLLELGRSHPGIHRILAEHAADLPGTSILHTPGIRPFPGNDDLRRTLAGTCVYLCFPKSATHPESAGGVETMTLRYLEGIASGCLPCGQCPQELLDLFGYDPVVPLNPEDPLATLRAIHRNLDAFEPLAKKNLRRLAEVGTWDQRAKTMLETLERSGYAVPPRTP